MELFLDIISSPYFLRIKQMKNDLSAVAEKIDADFDYFKERI